MRREVSWIASKSPCYVDVTFMPLGLHEFPDKLRAALAEHIEISNKEFPYDHYEENLRYDYIILIYGLCDNSVVGLSSPDIPLVIPRAHDCTSLLLGSKERYDELFHEVSGTFWYSRGWIERSFMPGEELYNKTLKEYIEKYGEDNAEYLMEVQYGWMKTYNRAYFIDWEQLGNSEYYRSYTKECAAYLKWNYEECQGSPLLLEKILSGRFDEEEVLIIPPGMFVDASFDKKIIKVSPQQNIPNKENDPVDVTLEK